MPSLKLAKVVANRKQVVNWLLIFFEMTYNIVTHVETLRRKLNVHILLCVIASESFEVDYQNRWHVVQLDFLHSLFMLNAFITIPCVCLAEIFGLVKLSETIVNTDVVSVLLLVTGLKYAFFIPY